MILGYDFSDLVLLNHISKKNVCVTKTNLLIHQPGPQNLVDLSHDLDQVAILFLDLRQACPHLNYERCFARTLVNSIKSTRKCYWITCFYSGYSLSIFFRHYVTDEVWKLSSSDSFLCQACYLPALQDCYWDL